MYRVSTCGARRDHPRIRGEHSGGSGSGSTWAGSSPHTRGALIEGGGVYRFDGIIPAYAGSTSPSTVPVSSCWDHPRIRGEHHRMDPTITRRSGSSPHTRGALIAQHHHSRKAGIIPAYAGSTADASPFVAAMPWRPLGIIPAYAGSTLRVSEGVLFS